jgi:hypothetical protein
MNDVRDAVNIWMVSLKLVNKNMTLPLFIRKWLGSWWGDYCHACGEKTFFDWEKFNAGYNTQEQCLNKKCSNYHYRNRKLYPWNRGESKTK